MRNRDEHPSPKELAIKQHKKLKDDVLTYSCCEPNKGCNRKNKWKKRKGRKPRYKNKRG